MHTIPLPVVRKAVSCLLVALLLSLSPGGAAFARAGSNVSGVVLDSSGATVAGASVSLLSSQQVTLGTAKTDSQGRFTLSDVPTGQYLLVVRSQGFADNQQAVTVGSSAVDSLEVRLDPGLLNEEVTVTTNPGVVESVEAITQQANVITEQQIGERAKSVTAQIANEEVGVHLQRTATVMSGIFVRGLTGNKVNIFIDGFRYSNASQRGGVNTFLVQNRVLGVGVNSAPLYTGVPGYVVFSVRGGIKLGERHEVMLDFDNIGDRNYRGISWGVDAPGRGVFMKYNLKF